jgi:hypothetical protein
MHSYSTFEIEVTENVSNICNSGSGAKEDLLKEKTINVSPKTNKCPKEHEKLLHSLVIREMQVKPSQVAGNSRLLGTQT